MKRETETKQTENSKEIQLSNDNSTENKTGEQENSEQLSQNNENTGNKTKKKMQELVELKEGKKKYKMIAAAAVAVAVLAVLLCIYIYSLQYNRRLTVIAPVGDIVFVEKHRDEEDCFVTFQAAEYNRIPAEVNMQGITIQIEPEFYDILVLNAEYASANIVFEVPQGVARKAGYDEAQANIQNLWTEDILKKYTSVRSIVWAVGY